MQTVPSWTSLADLGLGRLPQPEWDAAARRIRETLQAAHAHTESAERAFVLAKLAACLRSQPQPDWASASACYEEALGHCPESGRGADRGMILYMMASCLHEQPRPDWERALATGREALALFRRAGDAPGLRAGLYQVAWILRSGERPDPEAAARLYREAVDLAREADDREELELALGQLAACLDELPDQDERDRMRARGRSEELLDLWREAARSCGTPNALLALAVHLDRAGAWCEADEWLRRLPVAALSEEKGADGDSATGRALALRRHAYLALRRNDRAAVLAAAEEARGGPEEPRTRLLAAIVRIAMGEEEPEAGRWLPDDAAWGRKVAAGHFRRHHPSRASELALRFDLMVG